MADEYPYMVKWITIEDSTLEVLLTASNLQTAYICIEECKFPGAVKEFLKTDIFINAINYYEVKKWVAKQKEDGPQMHSLTRK